MILAYWEFLTPDNLLLAGKVMVATGWVLVKVGGLIIVLL
jgi:hypothetical protein